MTYKPHRLEPNYPVPEVVTTASPAPAVVVACWCGLVERMNRRTLDRFTRDIWKRFDHRDLEPLKWAIIRRRRVLAMQLRPVDGLEPAIILAGMPPGWWYVITAQ